MSKRSADCWACGHPGLRREGHAWWCEAVKTYITQRRPTPSEPRFVPCRNCGADLMQVGTGEWEHKSTGEWRCWTENDPRQGART